MKEQMKRVDVNARVQFDATGAGDWVIGTVVELNRKSNRATVQPAGGGDWVEISRRHLFKASKKEFDAAQLEAAAAVSEPLGGAVSGVGTDPIAESNEDTSETLVGGETRSIIRRHHRERYVTVKINGERHTDSGDPVATMLRGLDLDQALQSIADCMGETPDLYTSKWGHLNPGQIRMNAGNRLRHWLKKTGHTV